ncbi:proton-conducting transporter transmembrane domain-containing protein [Kocuria marina]|uniref:Proton-conducting membrane transporter n=1 Tax=Kocuria marina subsp. indica TaxID=1049583 RepID=A0A1X7D9R4_9MICC|nr:proton-conducting transporter membrane subunit [Kocuria indica]SMF11487.1 Proton-conducting membrane transporter [Kocuria indica]
MAGTVAFALGHGIAKAGLFLAAGFLGDVYGTDEINELRGAGKRHPVFVMAMGMCAVGLAGLPESLGFTGKWQVATSAVGAGRYWMLAVLVLGTLLSAAYLLKALAPLLVAAEDDDSEARLPDRVLEATPLLPQFAPFTLGTLTVVKGLLSAWSASVRGVVHLVHLVHQGLMKITLFLCAGLFAEALGITKLSQMHGLGRRMPWTSAAFTVGAFGMIGLPVTAGFVFTWMLGLGAMESERPWVVGVLIASSLLNAMYFLLVVYRMWFRDLADQDASPATSADGSAAGSETSTAGPEDSSATPSEDGIPVASDSSTETSDGSTAAQPGATVVVREPASLLVRGCCSAPASPWTPWPDPCC